jgi:dGTP triphosphohydrolase
LTHSLEVSCVGRSLGNDVSKALIARRPELQDSYLTEKPRDRQPATRASTVIKRHDSPMPPIIQVKLL